MSEMWEYGEAAGEASPDGGFPWPPSDERPALASFGVTWQAATFDPGSFFRRVPRDGGTGAALLYYLVLVLIVAGASLFWDSLALFTGGFEDSVMAAEMGLDAVSPVVTFLLTPAILLGLLVVSAAITHGLLSLFDGTRHGFGTTLRVFSYAYSPGLFGIIPFVGGVLGAIWMLVLLMVGLREAHETDGWKTAVAVLLPFALLVGFMVLALLMVFAAGAALLA